MAAKQKIMIVDDDSNIAELISLYLTKECFDTRIVGDGEAALRSFDSFAPNLILLDLMLPGMDGYQVCREIRQRSNVPIIMLSAKGEIFDKVLGLELGADDYMIKPFDSKELVARVKAVLRPFPAGQKRRGQTERKDRGVPGSHRQPDQLFRDLPRQDRGYASKGAGASLFPRSLSQSGFTREQLLDHIWGYEYMAIPGRWTFTSSASVKKSKTTRTGPSPLSGASATNLR